MVKETNKTNPTWKTKSYMIGVSAGAFIGFLSAYLFNRSAEEGAEDEVNPSVSTGALIGLLLSMLTLVRQIAESGKPPKKK